MVDSGNMLDRQIQNLLDFQFNHKLRLNLDSFFLYNIDNLGSLA